MMTTIQSQVRLWTFRLHRIAVEPRVHRWLRVAAYILSGFVLSAASLSHQCLPLAAALCCALPGPQALLAGAGAAGGYLLFWGSAGMQGVLWTSLCLLCAWLPGRSQLQIRSPMLLPAVAGVLLALFGLFLQPWKDPTPVMYILRIGLVIGGARLFAVVLERRDSIADWLACGVAVLALAQIAPNRWLSLGYPAAAALTVSAAFPAAAIAGLALDLGNVTPVPMTAVLALAWLLRFFPYRSRLLRAVTPSLVFPTVMILSGSLDLTPLPGLLAGGFIGLLIPGPTGYVHRRGEVGVAQVRLELVSSVFGQMQQIVQAQTPTPIDEDALILRACERACGTCTYRKSCAGAEQAKALTPQMLNFPILDGSLPFSCRRPGRLINELRRSQEQLRMLRSGQKRQEEYRTALVQQYRFLTEYLQDQSDELGKRTKQADPRYRPEVFFCGNRPMPDNGDRCLSFSGTGGHYYVAILDGMGSGIGAVSEAASAGTLLKQLLMAGYPAEYALETLNSLCALRDRAGIVTVDLAQIDLDSGKVSLYKWGAAPSLLLKRSGCEKIGTAGPPPGLSAADRPEAAQKLSLRRGELLALLSDGVGGENILQYHTAALDEPLGEVAARILEGSSYHGDDATVALIRLSSLDLSA